MEINREILTIIMGLMGFLQVILMLVVGRIFFIQDKTFSVISSNKRDCAKKIEKNYDEAKIDRENTKREYTSLLNDHYVTNGQLNTVEEKFIGQIENLSIEIRHLTNAIKSSISK